jgi:ADP-ribose pyrophosphatase
MTRRIVFTGRKIQVAVEETADNQGETIRRDVVLHPGAVAILPMIDADHVCLLQNLRPIVGKTLWEIPAGTLEPNELPDVAAPRELAEETGYQGARWMKLTTFFPSPGVLSERTHLYVAKDLTPGPMRLEADEQIEPHVVAWKDVLRWVSDGTIEDAKSMVAILLWDRLKKGAGQAF